MGSVNISNLHIYAFSKLHAVMNITMMTLVWASNYGYWHRRPYRKPMLINLNRRTGLAYLQRSAAFRSGDLDPRSPTQEFQCARNQTHKEAGNQPNKPTKQPTTKQAHTHTYTHNTHTTHTQHTTVKAHQ